MVLKQKIALIIFILFTFIKLNANINLFYTDKYDTNYFSTKKKGKTTLNIGSNLFKFISAEKLNKCGAFIDSILKKENISFDQNISLNNNNTLEITLNDFNAPKCSELSQVWFEKYNIAWIELLRDLINLKEIEENEAEKLILKKIYSDEQNRVFHASNVVNKTLIAFVIPESLSKNKFIKSKTVLNTKRYISLENEINYTEIINNNKLLANEISFNFPTANKYTFLKNSISLYIIKELTNEKYKLDINYSIAQTFIKLIMVSNNSLTNYKLNIDNISLGKDDFQKQKLNAINAILNSISENNLFFYSYYDILKLKQLEFLYEHEDLDHEIALLNNKSKFLIEISKASDLYINETKLKEFHYTDLIEEIHFKANSEEFSNINDTLLLDDIVLFLKLNTNYNLSIESYSKQSEYLFIEKIKKEAILNNFKDTKYNISETFKLKLFRSINLFSILNKKGIKTQRMNCVGLRGKESIVKFIFFKKD